ncbi:hypothetical protein B0H14DRAFT_2616464 [Mycena olivaceomarginata]|nr:hypothetical protein B0H14DRAFT_2616464 [Mycena olivaceomarginata]
MPISNWVNNLVQEPVNFAPLPPLSPADLTGPLPTRKERAENNLAQYISTTAMASYLICTSVYCSATLCSGTASSPQIKPSFQQLQHYRGGSGGGGGRGGRRVGGS